MWRKEKNIHTGPVKHWADGAELCSNLFAHSRKSTSTGSAAFRRRGDMNRDAVWRELTPR